MEILIRNATVYPIIGEKMEKGSVLIQNGKIVAIEPNIEPKETMRVINGENKFLFPGFIDAHTHLGLYDEGTGWAGNDANETVEALTPHIRAIDGVYPLDIGFKDAVKYGITTVHVMPGSANVIGGTTSVIKTVGKDIQQMILKNIAGLKIALGENPKRVHSNSNKNDITRMGIMGMLREAFYEAKHHPNPEDLRIAPILLALKREIPVRIHAHRADDIITAIRFAKEFQLDLRIEHCTEGHLIAEELTQYPLQVSIGPTLTRRSKIELKNKTWDTYRILTQYGIPISITTDHPYTPIQYLNICAAIAVREGLKEDDALRGITINPAKNLGVDDRVGSIEVGKDGDVVLWSHHPLSYMAIPEVTIINGEIVYEKK